MRKLLVAFSVLTISFSVPIFAQQTVPPPKPKVVSKPTPEPKKPLLKRIFGGRDKVEPAPAPTPAPVAKTTPKPRPRTRPKAAATAAAPAASPEQPAATASTPEEENKPDTGATPPAPTPAPAATAETTSQPPAPAPEPSPAATPEPKATGKKGSKKPAAKSVDTANMDESTKYKAVRAVAMEDPAIKVLKEKADSAINDTEAHTASVAYNKALFRKIREIEPSLTDFTTKLEASMLKLLNAERKAP